MGRLKFANGVRLDLDDRSLAHVNAVMQIKLRRGESFHLSWKDDPTIGDGRTTVWVHPETSSACTLGSRVAKLDPRWIEALMVTANSVGGMRIVDPPARDESPAWEGSHGEVSV
jgi:hypothetical protein